MKRIPLNEFIIIAIFFFLSGISNAANNENVIPTSFKNVLQLKHWFIAKDTAPNEQLPVVNDSLWILLDSIKNVEKLSEGNWLIRIDLSVQGTTNENMLAGLFPKNFITAYEIYWDGIKIARNGIIGTNENNEKAGQLNFDLPLNPKLLEPGKHTIILRLSNHHDNSYWKWFYGALLIGPYAKVLNDHYLSMYRSVFFAGILFIPFIFNLFLYFARKGRTEHLLFSLVCLVVISDFMVAFVSIFANIPTTYIHWENYLYQTIVALTNILFPAFFIYLFSLPRKTIAAVILIDIIVFVLFVNFWNVYKVSSLTVLIITSLITLVGLLLKREGSKIIFAGIALTWIAYIFGLSFVGLASLMAVCTSIFIAMQFVRKEKAEREAQLRSAHLENELLKKNINPHFLLNSLTSIIAWLRKDPASAVKLIEALADEFRMVMQISGLKLIPIRQEIDLCKTHLKIMNYRKDAEFNLIVDGTDDNDLVPPMIFHTLIENGLSHGYENKVRGTFSFQRNKISSGTRYILFNDGDFNGSEKQSSNGLGIKYVKSRLEESYPGRWKFISQRIPNGWETIIEITDD